MCRPIRDELLYNQLHILYHQCHYRHHKLLSRLLLNLHILAGTHQVQMMNLLRISIHRLPLSNLLCIPSYLIRFHHHKLLVELFRNHLRNQSHKLMDLPKYKSSQTLFDNLRHIRQEDLNFRHRMIILL